MYLYLVSYILNMLFSVLERGQGDTHAPLDCSRVEKVVEAGTRSGFVGVLHHRMSWVP